MRLLIYTILLSSIVYISSFGQNCAELEIWQGEEPVITYGMDTTDHWWAITQPFTNRYRLIVDGEESAVYNELTRPVFSPDGEKWAAFVFDGVWQLLTESDYFEINAPDYGEIIYSPDSKAMAFSYKSGSFETIVMGKKAIEVNNRSGKFFLSHGGLHYAFTGYRNGKVTFNIDGNETPLYDEAYPIGFWHDGGFLYAAKRGTMWQIIKNNEEISEDYYDITDAQVNIEGNVLAFAGKRSQNSWVAVMISDEFYEPLISQPYDNVYNLALHPVEEMMAFNARSVGRNIVVFNSAEYFAGDVNGRPRFSYDGEEMYFIGCAVNCFVNINGKRYTINTDMNVGMEYAIMPKSETIAYTSSTSLVIRDLKTKDLTSGLMVDELTGARYNWRKKRYEAIGRINQRLYLLVCKI